MMGHYETMPYKTKGEDESSLTTIILTTLLTTSCINAARVIKYSSLLHYSRLFLSMSLK
jgi:hypothetical protein